MTCYENLVDYKWMVNLFDDLNLRMACYDIVVDSKWPLTYLMVCNLRIACTWFRVNYWLLQWFITLKWLIMRS